MGLIKKLYEITDVNPYNFHHSFVTFSIVDGGKAATGLSDYSTSRMCVCTCLG